MAAESGILMASVFLPLLLSPLAYFIGKRKGVRIVTWFSFGILVISTILLVIPAITISSEHPLYTESYIWSQFGNFGLKLDGLSSQFAITIYALSAVIAIFSREYMVSKIAGNFENLRISTTGKSDGNYEEEEKLTRKNFSSTSKGQVETLYSIDPSSTKYINTQVGLYYALFLTFAMGMVGTVLATNLIEFYVFFELMLIPAFFLIALYGYSTRKRVSLMFFFWTHVGAVLLLLGLLAMGLFAGGFDFETIKANVSTIPSQWMTLIVFAVVIGIAVKLGVFILHIWIPHTYAESPTPISALIAGPMSGIGVYALLRIWMDLLSVSYTDYSIYINLWGVITMIYGGAMALMQDDIKKLLAYSSISHMGYIIFGLGSQSVLGITGGTLMWIPHAIGETMLFLMAGAIIMRTGTRSMSNLGGLARKMPYTATIAMIAILSLIGVPPTSGFMAEWILFNGALQSGTENMDSFRVVLFSLAIFSMVLVAALTLFLGVYPDPMINPVIGYTDAIFSNTQDVSSLPIIKNINTQGISSSIDLKGQNERFAVDNDHRYVIYNLNVNDTNNLEIK